MNLVRHKIYEINTHNLKDWEVIEKTHLLSLMNRNVSFKFYQNGLWDAFER